MIDTIFNLAEFLSEHRQVILEDWLHEQINASTWRADLLTKEELRQQSAEFLSLLIDALRSDSSNDINNTIWEEARNMLSHISRARAMKGFTPSETATFVFSLKQPLFKSVMEQAPDVAVVSQVWRVSLILDNLGLYTVEIFMQSRESLIGRQQHEMMELSTPVIKLWTGVLAIPLIGTLDSQRSQVVMENLLQKIVDHDAAMVIIDITGVPTVDTLVAQHLIKAIAAARLMGSDCIISGIRPQIAQTIVHLGIQLNEITTKANLADAFVLALQRTGYSIPKKLS